MNCQDYIKRTLRRILDLWFGLAHPEEIIRLCGPPSTPGRKDPVPFERMIYETANLRFGACRFTSGSVWGNPWDGKVVLCIRGRLVLEKGNELGGIDEFRVGMCAHCDFAERVLGQENS